MKLLRSNKNGILKVLAPSEAREFRFDPYNTESINRAKREADQYERQVIDDLTKKIGRAPTDMELIDNKVKAARDSRSLYEKMDDKKFKPAKNGILTPLEKLLAATEDELEKERYLKLSPLEQQREDLASMVAREEIKADNKSSHSERLEKYATTIKELKSRLHDLNWDPDADEKDRVQIEQAIQILETENSDLSQLKPRLDAINQRAEEQRINKLAGLRQQQDVINEQQAAINEQQNALGGENVSNAE